MAEAEAAIDAKDLAEEEHLPAGAELDRIVASAKEWWRRALLAVRLTPKLAGKIPAVAAGSSPARLEKNLKALLPLVGDPATVAHGGGKAVRAEGAILLKQLQAAVKGHQKALATVSQPVRSVNQKKGIVYEELRRLALTARTVVPEEAKLFAVSAQLRPGSAKKPVAKKPAAPPVKLRDPPFTGGAPSRLCMPPSAVRVTPFGV